MTGHRSRDSSASGLTRWRRRAEDAALTRVSRFVARPERVRAVRYDGSDAQAALVTRWVQQVVGSAEVKAEVEPGSVLVIKPAKHAQPVRLPPDTVLVLRSTGWSVHDPQDFVAAFELVPWELPIFDDGEVA